MASFNKPQELAKAFSRAAGCAENKALLTLTDLYDRPGELEAEEFGSHLATAHDLMLLAVRSHEAAERLRNLTPEGLSLIGAKGSTLRTDH